ncbi:MAG: Asp-tRNA(Asn)/Glu-tRNA(Gln) amidotransferase subunit GatB [Bacteroidetes bacterium]|nr:Asp-tRNA(Asn)/Glu-tRNA(Gln) amidotransferase subunit GatB [Bacteroidota bacterium]
MPKNKILENYIPVIGLEIHAQLSTKTKMFSPERYEYGALPNTSVSNITLAHPGTMPSINKKAIEYAIKMGLVCDCKINEYNIFARKNYFYPDLPKGYQITQHNDPICSQGNIIIDLENNKEKKVRINRIHLEEDTGKALHNIIPNKTLLDFNRAGAPLIEIVTEPDLACSKEAYFLLHEIRKIVRYLEICDGNMEEGSLRCDANISVMKREDKEYGQKVEVKNMNSIRNVQLAIEYEIVRQIEELEKGNTIQSETRSFNASNGKTIKMRTKETLSDYRYFPEPDISPIIINDKWINEIKSSIPILAREYYSKFTQEYKLPSYDAKLITENKELAKYFESICKFTKNYKSASNWIMGPIKSHLNDLKINISEFEIIPKQIASIISLIDEGKLNMSSATKILFPKLIDNPKKEIELIVKELNLIQEKDTNKIDLWINEVIKENPQKVDLYKKGKKGLLGMFMGEIMKKSKGTADPSITSQKLKEILK